MTGWCGALRRRRRPRPLPRAEGGLRALRRARRVPGPGPGRRRGGAHPRHPRWPTGAGHRGGAQRRRHRPRRPRRDGRPARGGRPRRRLRPQHDRAHLRHGPHAGGHLGARRRGRRHPPRPRREHPAVGASPRAAVGATVRWAEFDPASASSPRTTSPRSLIAHPAGGASPPRRTSSGTRPPVRAIADLAHAAGALVYVDGVHYTAHAPVDVDALGRRLLRVLAVQVPRPALRRARRATRRC